MTRPLWQFTITKAMTKHLDENELALFFSSLEDSIEEICENYKVEPWELEE
jgi:hypothetical protein